MAKVELTAQRLRELLYYDPDTGLFTWRVARGSGGRIPAGAVAGSRIGDGYLRLKSEGVQYKLHRVAVLYMTGHWPAEQVDHINGVRDDNRWSNLRCVGCTFNLQNQRRAHPGSASGLLGVSRRRDGRWKALITVNYVTRSLGTFSTPEDAHAAYINAKRLLHPGCTI